MNTDRTQPDGEICLDGPAQNLTPSPPGHAVGYVKILGGRYTLQVCRFSELSISTNVNCGIYTIVLQKSKNGCQDSKFQGRALDGVLEFMSKKLLYCDVFRWLYWFRKLHPYIGLWITHDHDSNFFLSLAWQSTVHCYNAKTGTLGRLINNCLQSAQQFLIGTSPRVWSCVNRHHLTVFFCNIQSLMWTYFARGLIL